MPIYNPQDGPGTVVPPTTITNSNLPPVDPNGNPTGVTPPSGWKPGDKPDEVQTLDAWSDFVNWLNNVVASTLAENSAIQQKQQNSQLGDKEASELTKTAARSLVALAETKLGSDAAGNLEAINNATKDWPAKDRLLFYIDLGYRIQFGLQNVVSKARLNEDLKKLGSVARDASRANAEARQYGGTLGLLINEDDKGNPSIYSPNSHLRAEVLAAGAVRGMAAFQIGQSSTGLRNFLVANSGFGLTDAIQGAVAIGAVAVGLGVAGKTLLGGSSGSRQKPLLPGELDVGRYDDLKYPAGDSLSPHHILSSKFMLKNASPADPKWTIGDGITMRIEDPRPLPGTGRHQETYTYGLKDNSDQYFSLSPRDALAFDIRDMRNIYMSQGLYRSDVRKALQQVIELNKTSYPNTFRK